MTVPQPGPSPEVEPSVVPGPHLAAPVGPAGSAVEPDTAVNIAADIRAAVSRTIRGKDDAVALAVVALLSGGHLLVEDLPGTGKTLLAKSLAAVVGGRFGRVQCTPDLLPTDITGTSVYSPADGSWSFRAGPLFAHVLLVDEINRASPRTQSALLEPMEEHQVTVDGATRALPDPFFCMATQNPHGQIGTFPLPESQLDRFGLVLSMGIPGRDAEREVLTGCGGADALAELGAVTDPDALRGAQAAVRRVHCAAPLVEYVLDLADATRRHPGLTVGASPRASLGLLHASRAHAVVAGRTHVTPDDVQAVLVPALAHRVSVGGVADIAGAARVLSEVMVQTAVPRPT